MKLAIITGGSKGLGKALVDLFDQKGWMVRELSRSGDSQYHIDCDFSDALSSAKALNDAFKALSEQQFDEIVLINNVGTVNPIGPIHLDKPDDWQANIQINLNACIMATGLFIQYFSEQSGKHQIANISSGAASKAFFGWSLYCAAKAGVEAFTDCVALEQSRSTNPVTIFSVRPGVIDTGMQKVIRSQDKDRFEDIEGFKALKSDQNLRTPQVVASAVYAMMGAPITSGQLRDVADWISE